MTRYNRGVHGKRGEMKGAIMAEIIKGICSVEDLRTTIKRNESLRNGKDVTYHLVHGSTSLKGLGLIKIKNGKISLNVKDTSSLVVLMSILLSNDAVYWELLPHLIMLNNLSRLFVHDKWHFQNMLRWMKDPELFLDHLTYLRNHLSSLSSGGLDMAAITRIYFRSENVVSFVPPIVYVMGENLQLDEDVRNGVRDPEFRIVGSLDFVSLRSIRFAPSITDENDYPYVMPRNEEKAVEEFVLGFLRPVLSGQNPELSMYHPSMERIRLLLLLDRAEMTIQQMRRTTASDAARLRVDETIQVDVEELMQEGWQGQETADIFDTSIRD